MFHDLDATLTALLGDNPKASNPYTLPGFLKELEDAEKSFVVPDKNYLPTVPTLNLFLHSVKENRELRDNAPTVDVPTRRRDQPPRAAPRGVHLPGHRLGRQTPIENVVIEHQLLGQALYWLSRFSTIPKDYLRGSLVNQPYDAPMQVAQMPGDAGLGQFWTALGIAPRPSFYLTVTIAMQIVTGPKEPDYMVKEIKTDILLLSQRSLCCKERSEQTNGEPVLAATVSARGTGKIAKTDTYGRFRLEGLNLGAYHLLVQAEGYDTLEEEVHFTRQHQVFHLTVEMYHQLKYLSTADKERNMTVTVLPRSLHRRDHARRTIRGWHQHRPLYWHSGTMGRSTSHVEDHNWDALQKNFGGFVAGPPAAHSYLAPAVYGFFSTAAPPATSSESLQGRKPNEPGQPCRC